MSSRRPQLILLLEAISSNREDLALDEFDAITVAGRSETASDRCCIAACAKLQSLANSHWSSLKAADLTARIVIGERLQAVQEIGDACRSSLPPDVAEGHFNQ